MPATYSVKAALRGVSPMIWRRLRLEGNTSLAALHFIIQRCFGWDDEHLHQFHTHGKDFGICWEGGLSFADDAFQVRLDDFGFEVGDRFTYEYNFYAEWLLDIRIEAIEEPSRKQTPFCFSGTGMLGATAIDVFEKTMDLLKLILLTMNRSPSATYGVVSKLWTQSALPTHPQSSHHCIGS